MRLDRGADLRRKGCCVNTQSNKQGERKAREIQKCVIEIGGCYGNSEAC